MRRCEFITLIGGATASRPRAPRGTWVAAGGLPLVAKTCNKIAARRLNGWLWLVDDAPVDGHHR